LMAGTADPVTGQPELSTSAYLVLFVAGSVMSFLWLRLAVSLPAVAIGKTMGIKEAWGATAPLAMAIFGVAVILVAFNLLVGAAMGQIFASGSYVGLVVNLLVQWFTLMVGVSILTTIYGHVVEGRDLV